MSSAIDRRWLMRIVAACVIASAACAGERSAVDDELDAGSMQEDAVDAGPSRCFFGDHAQPPEIEIIHRTLDGHVASVADDAPIPLIQPPQGGKVMLIGVRARNVDSCSAILRTALIDPETSAVIALESRPVGLVEGASGWLEPRDPAQLSNYSNLPTCPRAALTRDIEGQPYRLDVELRDFEGHSVRASRTIIPTCAADGTERQCHCECTQSYRLGSACPRDRPDSASKAPDDAQGQSQTLATVR